MIHPVDEYVGRRLRARRTTMGLSQEEIGNQVGITFQQLQKYEKGMNRIAISRLYDFGVILKVSVSWFVEGYGEAENCDSSNEMEIIENRELLTLVRTYKSIPPTIRKKSLSLFKSIANANLCTCEANEA